MGKGISTATDKEEGAWIQDSLEMVLALELRIVLRKESKL